LVWFETSGASAKNLNLAT